MQSVGSKFGIRAWVGKVETPLEGYFFSIDEIINALRSVGVNEPSAETVVTMLAAVLNEENALFAYIDSKKKDVSEASVWLDVCSAAAWVIVQKYSEQRESEEGS